MSWLVSSIPYFLAAPVYEEFRTEREAKNFALDIASEGAEALVFQLVDVVEPTEAECTLP